MATHADIWLPLDPARPRGPMLYCEAWSDGYMSGVGFGALCSSSAIDLCCELSALLAGSPVFHSPSTGAFYPKEGDYVAEGFLSSDETDDDPDALEAMIEEALAAMSRGDAQAALSGALGQMSLQEKLRKGYGVNAHTRPFEGAWSHFLASLGARDDLSPQESAERLALALRDEEHVDTAHGYFWRDGQFWGLFSCSDGEDSEDWSAAPLIQLAALERQPGTLGDLPGYLARLVENDRLALMDLLEALSRVGAPSEGLFDGSCDAQIRSLREAFELEKDAACAFVIKRPTAL